MPHERNQKIYIILLQIKNVYGNFKIDSAFIADIARIKHNFNENSFFSTQVRSIALSL